MSHAFLAAKKLLQSFARLFRSQVSIVGAAFHCGLTATAGLADDQLRRDDHSRRRLLVPRQSHGHVGGGLAL